MLLNDFVFQREKLEKLKRWRIQHSLIEFSGDAREFRGGYATVSQAVLLIPSDVKAEKSEPAEGGSKETGGEVSKPGESKPGTQTFERMVSCYYAR